MGVCVGGVARTHGIPRLARAQCSSRVERPPSEKTTVRPGACAVGVFVVALHLIDA
jgi:hypothetical protein